MLCLEGGFLIEKICESRSNGEAVASEKNHLKSLKSSFLPLSGAGSTDPGIWECCCSLCSALAEPGSGPVLTLITSQLARKVTAHKYKVAPLGGRFPRAAVLALHIKPSVLVGDKSLEMDACRTLSSSCPAAVCTAFPCLIF